MGLIYKFQEGGSITKKMLDDKKPKYTLAKEKNINSESTNIKKVDPKLVKSLTQLEKEKFNSEHKEQPVISQGRELTEQEKKTSDKINNRLENKKKYENSIIGDLGIDPSSIGITAGNLASKLTRLRPLSEDEIIKSTDNYEGAKEVANEIAKDAVVNEIAGKLLTKPLGVGYSAVANSINRVVKNPFPNIKNFQLLPSNITNSRLINPGLLNKTIKKYPMLSEEVVGQVAGEQAEKLKDLKNKLSNEIEETKAKDLQTKRNLLYKRAELKKPTVKNKDINSGKYNEKYGSIEKPKDEDYLNNFDDLRFKDVGIDELKILAEHGKQPKITAKSFPNKEEKILDEFISAFPDERQIHNSSSLEELLNDNNDWGFEINDYAKELARKHNLSLDKIKNRLKEKNKLEEYISDYGDDVKKDLAEKQMHYSKYKDKLHNIDADNFAIEAEDIQLTPEEIAEYKKIADKNKANLLKQDLKEKYKGIDAFQSVKLNKKGGLIYNKK